MPTPRLLDQVCSTLRVRLDRLRAEEACLQWIKRYIFFPGKQHPARMWDPEITAFLSLMNRRMRTRMYGGVGKAG